MQLRANTDFDGSADQLVVQCVPAVPVLAVDEVGMVAGHRDALFVLGIRNPASVPSTSVNVTSCWSWVASVNGR